MEKENRKVVKNWSYQEGKALISVYENRKEEYFITRNKKHFWVNLLTDLESLNVLISPTTAEQVEVKWRSLYRAYKKSVDRGTGSSISKFQYLEEMDKIFHDNPSTSSPHSVSVGVERYFEIEIEPVIDTDSVNNTEWSSIEQYGSSSQYSNNDKAEKEKPDTGRKRRSNQNSLLEIKKCYYEKKIEEKKKKREFLEKYLENKEKAKEERHKEILSILQQK